MADAFSDIWSSTGVSKPTEPPRKLGTLASTPPVPGRAQNDVFSLLAAAGSSSTVGSRSATPGQPSALGSAAAARPMQKAASTGTALGGNDAFSGLLSGFSATQSSNNTNLTIAQRAALVEKERQERAQQKQQTHNTVPVASAWAGLDALGNSSITNPHTSPPSHDPLDDLGFGTFASSSPQAPPIKVTQSAPPPDDDWGFGEFASQSPAAPSSKQKATSASQFDDLLGFDDFAAPSVPRPSRSPDPPPRSNTPGDFDFGNREDGLLGNQSSDDDDILGDLSKPVEKLAARQSARNTPSPRPLQSGPRSRAVSPPPHILGQIVEMGFSIQQARVALAATDTGVDVQAALDMLLSNGAGLSSPTPEEDPQARQRANQEPGHERYYESEEEGALPSRPPRRAPGRSPPQAQRSARDRPAREAPISAEAQKNLQEQADKLIAQASEVGLNLFNRANAFWKEGKERVQRAYEERAAAAGTAAGPSRQSTGESVRKNGKPKWMQDAYEDEHAEATGSGSFKDEDGVSSPPRRANPRRQQPPPPVQEQPASESPASRLKVGNLFSDDPPAVYVSPFRRKGPSRAPATDNNTAAASVRKPSSTPSPARAPSPIALVQRHTVPATSVAIAESAKHKAAGTERYKLGQYAEAESLYSAAINTLPSSHLLLVPLLNNRALTRLKTGDHAGAVEDCTAVINLIGTGYHPAREAKVVREEDGASVDLADGLVKAWRRRAEAHEGREKWDAAKQDWEAIAAAEFAGKLRSEAVRGVGRCRRMLNTDAGSGSAPAVAPKTAAARPAAQRPKPKPALPKPAVRVPTPPSEALNRVRAANEAAEAEDQERHELKDAVEARLGTWKAGKEANLRALIASLDTVLWPELGWQKVGIHELVSPSQVKIRYTKAIAKVHPDKLNVRNTTVEQRMIANGVFGALNEAWNAFKP